MRQTLKRAASLSSFIIIIHCNRKYVIYSAATKTCIKQYPSTPQQEAKFTEKRTHFKDGEDRKIEKRDELRGKE